MDIKTLMVGDWVQGNPCGQHCDRNNNTYYKIAVLDIGNHCWGYSVCGAIVELKYNDIFPIPLTPEILEKNGFERALQVSDVEPFDVDEDGNKHYSYNKTFWGWFQPDNIFCIPANGMGWLYIKYVHQLQHALRLCGIEKEIEL